MAPKKMRCTGCHNRRTGDAATQGSVRARAHAGNLALVMSLCCRSDERPWQVVGYRSGTSTPASSSTSAGSYASVAEVVAVLPRSRFSATTINPRD